MPLPIQPHEFPSGDKHRHALTLNHMKSLLHDLHCQHDKHKKNAIFILKIAFFLQAILTSSPCVATSKLGDESRSQTEICFGSTHLLPIATFRLNAVFLWPWKLIILPRQCQASQFRDEDRREDADLWKVAHRRFETVDAFMRACILNLDSPDVILGDNAQHGPGSARPCGCVQLPFILLPMTHD